nr:helix-turn-helix domain-containing protein [uncultured Draconibacterium sp.]
MSEIKCFENYKRLKEMLIKGEKGNADYFSKKLGISNRTFYRLIKYLKDIEQLKIKLNTVTNCYYLDLT